MFGLFRQSLTSYRHEVSAGVMRDLRADGISEIEIKSYLDSMDYAVTVRTAYASKLYPAADLCTELVLILTENRGGSGRARLAFASPGFVVERDRCQSL